MSTELSTWERKNRKIQIIQILMRLVPSQLSEQTRKQRHKMAAHFIKSIEIERKFSEKQCNKVPHEKAYTIC
jgi:hypothetical protein